MKLATTPEEQRRWLAQWRLAAVALEAQKSDDMRALTETEARAASEMLLAAVSFRKYVSSQRDADGHEISGLIEQQRLFFASSEREFALFSVPEQPRRYCQGRPKT